MIYPFMTLDDGTEIVHSEYHDDETVKVYVETADEVLGFKHATCWLPSYKWDDLRLPGGRHKKIRGNHPLDGPSDYTVLEGRRL